MDLLSRLDFYELGRRYILARASRIDPGLVDTEGSDANLFVGSMSFVASAISRQLAERLSALLLDGAEGEDLDRYAFDRYQLFRKGASPALGKVQVTRPTASAGSGAVPIGTKLVTLSGVEYITTTQTSFATAALTATPDAEVRAVQAGKEYQVGANQIRKFANVASLFDQSLIVNNSAATAGGENVEEADDFRERVRDFWNAARRGTLKAIEFGARTVPGVTSAQAVEALSSSAQPARLVNLYLADSSGISSVVISNLVNVALLEYRAAGIMVITSTSVPQIVSVVLALSFSAGVNTVTLTENIRAAVFEYINSLPVNGMLTRGALFSVLQRFVKDGLLLKETTIVAPAGDVVPELGSTLRTLLSEIGVV